MASIEVIHGEREPNVIQLYAVGADASVAAIAGSIQAAVWLPLDTARRLYVALGLKLGAIEREGGQP